MFDAFQLMQNGNPVILAFIGTCFTWLMTALGASAVFFTRSIKRRTLNAMLGFAGGIMVAASFWSLLLPAIEASRDISMLSWAPALTGFATGTLLLWVIGRSLVRLESERPLQMVSESRCKRCVDMLLIAMTLHNIPEGIAIGVAFGAVAAGLPSSSLPAAIALAIGIGIQDIPEGMAVSMPMRGEGVSRLKSFWYGQLTGIAEILGGILGAATVYLSRLIMPYILGFAAGAMIFVVVNDLIPESKLFNSSDIPTISFIIGFMIMTALDVSFGNYH
jgi:ZIP family zinc transporter